MLFSEGQLLKACTPIVFSVLGRRIDSILVFSKACASMLVTLSGSTIVPDAGASLEGPLSYGGHTHLNLYILQTR